MIRTTLYFTDDLHRDLRIVAARAGLSMSAAATRAIKLWLKEEWLREQVRQGKG